MIVAYFYNSTHEKEKQGIRVAFQPFFRRSVLTFLPPRRLVSISRIYLFISRNFTLSVALKAF